MLEREDGVGAAKWPGGALPAGQGAHAGRGSGGGIVVEGVVGRVPGDPRGPGQTLELVPAELQVPNRNFPGPDIWARDIGCAGIRAQCPSSA